MRKILRRAPLIWYYSLITWRQWKNLRKPLPMGTAAAAGISQYADPQ